MKQNIIMVVILITLFFFGLLIYDFSDALDDEIVSHDWYLMQEEQMTIMSFKNNQFSYYYEATKKPVTLYDSCLTYRFNRSINVIKLNCSVKGNKLYIVAVNDETLMITVEGEEKTFYATKEAAEIINSENKNNSEGS